LLVGPETSVSGFLGQVDHQGLFCQQFEVDSSIGMEHQSLHGVYLGELVLPNGL
jgi:hypothetical protein